MKRDLKETLRDIGTPFGLKPEYDPHHHKIKHHKVKPAPHQWEQKKHLRGENFDYETYDHGDTTVFYPVCVAAEEWAAMKFGEGAPRWGAKGYIVETRRFGEIETAAFRDGLISEDYYEAAMLNDQDARAGDD